MPRTTDRDLRNELINKLASDINLPDVARSLGLRVVAQGVSPPKALCPFHDDRHPSLSLFPSTRSGRPQFHCFACGAHGDVFDLIKRLRGIDFLEALDWLAAYQHVTIPTVASTTRHAWTSPRIDGLTLGFKIYQRQTAEEQALLQRWAESREISKDVLHTAEVFASLPPKIVPNVGTSQREEFDALEAAGLLRRVPSSTRKGAATLPIELPAREFFSTPRIIFTIRDHRNQVAGFVGRSLEGDSPKYLFSPEFSRSSTLYRLNKVWERREPDFGPKNENLRHLFIVEGLMDALRLETVGLDAVAILGSGITDAQVELLRNYVSELDRGNIQLALHFFLDVDEAGKRGTVAGLAKVLLTSLTTPGILVDVVVPPSHRLGEDQKVPHDPDELLRGVETTRTALERLSAWSHSPMTMFLASALDVHPSVLTSTLNRLPDSQRLRAFRDVERRFDRSQWISILDRVPAFQQHLDERTQEEPSWQFHLSSFLRAASQRAGVLAIETTSVELDSEARVVRALQIAEASMQRREFPIDEGSWERLQATVDVTLEHLREMLSEADKPERLDAGPMLAVWVPKTNGFRLKALPNPEILTLQQYVLNELLRDYSACPRFLRLIPAVRFSKGALGTQVETTGPEEVRPIDGTVSFAYMLDSDVIEHRTAPQRTGMFRSYFDCWSDFIAHVDERVAAFPIGRYHVARLDIRSFYKTVPRLAVNNVLLEALADGLAELADSTTEPRGAVECAKLFLPGITDPQARAHAIVDWLCDQSFGYKIEDPGTGELTRGEDGLPQGPDLSAYLANISLFPLDRRLSQLVSDLDQISRNENGPSSRGAVYARYVDDMVIITRSANDLSRLRLAIEKELAVLGMELSPKTDSLPVMDQTEVREWLTNSRGAGLGVSGPFEGPPANVPFGLLEPLAHAGETDRSDVLLILHDPRLDDPDTKPEELEDAVSAISGTKGLRHGDLIAIARRLWRSVLARIEKDQSLDSAYLIAKLWNEFELSRQFGEDSEIEQKEVAPLLAWLDGLERFLGSRQDRNPIFSEEKHRSLLEERKNLARLVHEGLCEELINKNIGDSARRKFGHMLELKVLAIRNIAMLVAPNSLALTSITAGKSRSKARLLISLAENQQSADLLDKADLLSGELVSTALLFHQACARLRIANNNYQEGSPNQVSSNHQARPDPLQPLAQSMDHLRQLRVSTVFAHVLDLWIPGPAHETNRAGEIALRALINLAPKCIVHLLETRLVLKSFALDPIASNLHQLPTPPGIDVPGILGQSENYRTVFRATFRSSDEIRFSPPLDWKSTSSTDQLERENAQLATLEYLPPPTEFNLSAGTPHWLASAFRSLARRGTSETESSCPPTALNLLGPGPGKHGPDSEWETLGFCVQESRVRGQSFLRLAGGGLHLESVTDQYDHLWRVGTALADWLGRAHSSRNIANLRLSAPSLITDPDDDWSTEGMLRFSLYRLRGRGLQLQGRPLRISPDTNLPMTIERVLRRLETFPENTTEGNGAGTLAYLVATLAEGRAIQSRLTIRFDPNLPGGAAPLLARMIDAQFQANEELAQRLPVVDELPTWAPIRRAARSFLALAYRLESLATIDPLREQDPTLQFLASGTRLLAAESNLRSTALELWATVDQVVRENFINMPPAVDSWGLDSTALFFVGQPAFNLNQLTSEQYKGSEPRSNVRILFQQLHQATIDNQPVKWPALADITPLGWLVVIGTLVGNIDGEWRGALGGSSLKSSDGTSLFDPLIRALSISADGDDDVPWGGLEQIKEVWGISGTQKLFEAMNEIDLRCGLEVSLQESARFQLFRNRRGPTEVHTSNGLRRLPSWAVNWSKTSDEHSNGTERAAGKNEDDQVFRWTETWRKDRLLGVGVVQPAMAALAGAALTGIKDSVEHSETTAREISKEDLEIVAEETDSSTNIDQSRLPSEEELKPLIVSPVEDQLTNDRAPNKKPPYSQPQPIEISSALKEIREMQEDSWTSRSEKPGSHARVALLQWEVDSSFLHPGYDLCDSARNRFDRKHPEKWTTNKSERSCAEARRRTLLKEVLQACNRFKVEILLLPEYSVRPETVAWLIEQLPSLSPTTSVWAGTYRLPPNMLNEPPFNGWSAIHELVTDKSSTTRSWRAKKYPAAVAGEVFNPGTDMLPLFREQVIGDIRSYTLELICSEVFLVTCPANIRPMARARRDLLRKFGNKLSLKKLEEIIKEDLVPDVIEFARLTALSEGLMLRRTILLVPAMTTRTADYTVLGQAAYLSSGLTTVFCNAVHNPYGHGESCFVGHDGWRRGTNEEIYPGTEPYHGVTPGIFRLNKGQLGQKEQALVIADIDPVYTFGGRPHPQMLLKPLNLVAHLPIFESWQPNADHDFAKCRCKNGSYNHVAVAFAPDLLNALKQGVKKGWKQTGDDTDPQTLFNALQQLAGLSDHGNTMWLRRRSEAYPKGHLSDPVAWPPAVALDWLWVDVGKDAMPEIEAPAYSAPPQ